MNSNNFEPIPIPSDDEIRAMLVRRIDQQKQAVGIVVGVIEPEGRRVIAYGSMAKDNPHTVNGDTIFEIGSITKVFTSLLLADMVVRKEVALDDPAAKYLPRHVGVPEKSGKFITLLDLSMHSSGLPRLPTNLKPSDPANPYAHYGPEELYEFLSGYVLPRDPGSEVEYSNLGGGLLGHVLAFRAGMDYEGLIRCRITEPLGMPDTGITLSSSMQERMATGHDSTLAPAANWDFRTLAGAGALRSTANDMLTLLEAFLGYHHSPLTPAMKATRDNRRRVKNTNFEMGLGWNIFAGTACHDGGTGGFCSFVGFDPKRRVGVVVWSNASSPRGVSDLGIHLLNQKVPLPDSEPWKEVAGIHVDGKILDNYTGRYRLASDRVFEISRDGDRLFAQGLAGSVAGPKFEMLAESETTFFIKVTGSQITFETDADGRTTSLTMRRAGREPTSGTRLP